MIRQSGPFFLLETAGTAYCFRVTEQGFLQHLYYGKRLDLSAGYEALIPRTRHWPGSAAGLEGTALEDMALEASFPGLGDLREPFAVVRTADGDIVTDFRFESAEILEKKPALEGLPSACAGPEDAETLRLLLAEKRTGLRLELLYRAGLTDKVVENIDGYFYYMAQKTGTLWENDGDYASCNHGFASHVLYWLNGIFGEKK